MMNSVSFIVGFMLVVSSFVAWVYILKGIKTESKKVRIILIAILKYPVLITLVIFIVKFDLANLYFFAGTIVGAFLSLFAIALFGKGLMSK